MKVMTCKQLGGACEEEFKAETFDEMADLSKAHGTEMYQKGDQPHINAMNKMMAMMMEAGAMKNWMEDKQKQFDSMPEIT